AGYGTVTTAACAVHPSGKAFVGQWASWSDEFIPSLRRAAEAIHRANPEALAILQIHHGGRSCPQDLPEGGPIAPSAVPAERPGSSTPREMTADEVVRSVNDFAQAAQRGIKAGFDGIEIHGANTYLIQQFVSPHSNRRTDRWNADDLRFPIELTEAVRRAIGSEPILGYRFSPEEPETPGIRLDRTERLLDALLATGALDYLHISLRNYDQMSLHGEDHVLQRISGHIAGRLPLIGVGSVKVAEDVAGIRKEGADYIAVGRAALMDPEWPLHVERGEPTRIVFPRENWAERCTIPAGLAKKIAETPGWFPFEEEPHGVN
ncbi:NADH-dependent flavin oxidoreductase, partial [bacterium]